MASTPDCSMETQFQSGRQESNLPRNAYQAVVWLLGHGPEMNSLYGNRTRLTCSTNRPSRQLRHKAETARTERVEPSVPVLEAGYSTPAGVAFVPYMINASKFFRPASSFRPASVTAVI